MPLYRGPAAQTKGRPVPRIIKFLISTTLGVAALKALGWFGLATVSWWIIALPFLGWLLAFVVIFVLLFVGTFLGFLVVQIAEIVRR